MDTDEDQIQAARNRALHAMRRPQAFTPWEEAAPDGWELSRAIYALTLPDDYWRQKVQNHLADKDVGLTPERWVAERDLLWQHIHWRLQQGQLVARGRVDGVTLAAPEVIDRDVLDSATPDFIANTLTCGSTVFRSIRLFVPIDVPFLDLIPTQSVVDRKGIGGRKPKIEDAFVTEMLRFALQELVKNVDEMVVNMQTWNDSLSDDQKLDPSTVTRKVKRYWPAGH